MPRVELYSMDIGAPIQPLERMVGGDHEWMIYTADRESEIIVTPEKVPMLLEEIRKAQAPRAKEILLSQRKREYQELETKAKILSFG